MANHASALKRVRSDAKKRLRNRYQLKTCRTFIKRLKLEKKKEEATVLFNKVSSMMDKLVKKNIVHRNKAANNKSKLAKMVNGL